MKICSVICEFNPLHSGHEYILSQARRVSGCDFLIAIMSGNFCQRAEPAFVSANIRAEAALKCGADMVIELPVVYATASADRFAYGAIEILKTLPNVTHLVMGSECNNADLLCRLGEIQATENQIFTDTLKLHLCGGKSYARAITEATAVAAEAEGIDGKSVSAILNSPNNILAVAYKKMLLLSDSDIAFCPQSRIAEQITASEIRTNFANKTVKKSMPAESFRLTKAALANNFLRDNEYGAIMMHTLRTSNAKKIAQTPDCNEGLEYKIIKAAHTAATYNEMLGLCSSSRYTNGRIKRICVQNLLGIEKGMQYCGFNYARLLGLKESAAELLSVLPNNIITKKLDENNIPTGLADIYKADLAAYDVHSLVTHDENGFYKKLLKI